MKEGFLLHSVHQTFSLGGNIGAHGLQVPCLGFAGLISRTLNLIFKIVKIRKPCFYPWQLPSQSKTKEDGSPNLGIVIAGDREDNEGGLCVILV